MWTKPCEGCPYHTQRGVPPCGPDRAPIVCLGEAPGDLEMLKGEPFVGPTGQLLTQLLTDAGFDPDNVLYVNALRCKPPREDKGKEAQDLMKGAIKICREHALHAIGEHPRQLVIALGASALQAMTENYKLAITKERGIVREMDYGPLVPTFHPAYALRNAGALRYIKMDLRAAYNLTQGHAPPKPEPTTFNVIRTFNEYTRWAKMMDELHPTVASLDIETTSLSPRAGQVVAIGISIQHGHTTIFTPNMLPYLNAWLCANEFANVPIWVGHNIKFDSAFLTHHGYPVTRYHDTMLLSYCLSEYRGHGLKQLASDHLGADKYDAALDEYIRKHKIKSYGDIPEDILFPYLAMDADYTLQLFHTLYPQVQAHAGLNKLYHDLLIPASHMLQEVERVGIWLDVAKAQEQHVRLTAERDIARAKLVVAVAPFWNPDKFKTDARQKRKLDAITESGYLPGSYHQNLWLLQQLGFKVKDTNVSTLATLPPHPFTAALLEWRKAAKALSTYVETPLEIVANEADGRIHSTYLIHGTVTGRLSSSDPNLQNIPRDKRLRGMYGAPPGRVIVEADYRAAELRVLALYSGDPFLAQVYQEDRDLHTEVAITIFGANFTQEQRTKAKNVNFGIAYGITAVGLSHQIKVSEHEAQRMIDAWYARMPLAKRYLDGCASAALAGKVLRTPFGRCRRYGVVTKENANAMSNEAKNYSIQSTASDFTLASAIAIQPQLPRGCVIVNIVHDSILIEVPDRPEMIRAVAQLMAREMVCTPVRLLNAHIPFAVDLKVGRHWGYLEEYNLDS